MILLSILVVLYTYMSYGACEMTFISMGNLSFDRDGLEKTITAITHNKECSRMSLVLSPGGNFRDGVSGKGRDADIFYHDNFEVPFTKGDDRMYVPLFSVMGYGDWNGNYVSPIRRTSMDINDDNKFIGEDVKLLDDNDRNMDNDGKLMINIDKRKIPQWTMPNYWYKYSTHFTDNNNFGYDNENISVGYIFIDTYILSTKFPFKDIYNKAWQDLVDTLDQAPYVYDYIFVIGDRSIYSSGTSRGNEDLGYYLLPLLKRARVDAYISGDDEIMEVIDHENISHINCGNSSVSRRIYGKLTHSSYAEGILGYCVHKVDRSHFTTSFYDDDNNLRFTHTNERIMRPERTHVNALNHLSLMPKVEYIPIPSSILFHTHGGDMFTSILGNIGIIIIMAFMALGGITVVAKNVD